jgi:hypothetical protein
MPGNSDYFFFKEGIIPKWEDPHHLNGGNFNISLDRDKAKADIEAECHWLSCLMSCVGSMFDHHDKITGVSFSKRPRGDRVQLWMSTCDPEAIRSVETDLKPILQKGLSVGGINGSPVRLQFSSFHGKSDHGGSGGSGRSDRGERHEKDKERGSERPSDRGWHGRRTGEFDRQRH